jgi:hypothetical protein
MNVIEGSTIRFMTGFLIDVRVLPNLQLNSGKGYAVGTVHRASAGAFSFTR